MGRFKIDHLVDTYLEASCGFDAFVGFFAEVSDVRRTKPKFIYDKMQTNYDHKFPLLGALRFLEAHGFIMFLDEALGAVGDEELEPAVARTMNVIFEFKHAAD